MITVPCNSNENGFRSEISTFKEISLLLLFLKQQKVCEKFLCKFMVFANNVRLLYI